ncbi:MAG: hypothetical protein JKY42_04575 [Flavobacteriales bacterium]|nr:hypothetical protein [Flavobacteriales bacterium]
MNDPEKIFHEIINHLGNGSEGKMFGAKCIKSTNGKTAAFFWKEYMVFKLDDKSYDDALKIEGAKIGSHLYDSSRQLKGWVSIPKQHSDKWEEFSQKALKHIENLNR